MKLCFLSVDDIFNQTAWRSSRVVFLKLLTFSHGLTSLCQGTKAFSLLAVANHAELIGLEVKNQNPGRK